jgi:hypothetical protein
MELRYLSCCEPVLVGLEWDEHSRCTLWSDDWENSKFLSTARDFGPFWSQ